MTPQPLDTLINLATKTRDSASRMLACEQRDYIHICTQVEQLKEYRQEYHHQLQTISGEGVELETFREYQRFLSSLDTTISQAMHELEAHEQRVNHCQQRWREEQHKLTSYDTLADRRNTLKRKEEHRQEQRLQDDATVNSIARKWMQESS